MGFRLAMMLGTAGLCTAALSAAAWSLAAGQTDRAIAYGWPVLGLTVIVAILTPGRSSQSDGGRGVKNGA